MVLGYSYAPVMCVGGGDMYNSLTCFIFIHLIYCYLSSSFLTVKFVQFFPGWHISVSGACDLRQQFGVETNTDLDQSTLAMYFRWL